MSKVFTSCAIDVLQIFGKVMCFFQNVGAVDAYSFSHTTVNFNPNLHKYIQGFISYLEEIKVVLDRLYLEQNKVLTKTHEFAISTDLQNSQTFKELQNRSGILNSDIITSSKNHLLLSGDDLVGSNNQIHNVRNEELIPSHGHNQIGDTSDGENIITFGSTLIAESGALVGHGSYIDTDNGKVPNNDYIDLAPALTPSSQLISSTIESLVQESSHQDEEEEDILNNEEITFRPLDVRQVDSESRNNEHSNWHSNEDKAGENSIKELDEKNGYSCQQCGKVLSSKPSLLHHINIHSGLKPFCCEHCGKLFTTSTNLSAHLTRQHNLNTEFAHSCSECGRLFVRKSALNLHLAGHRGLKPFKCSLCHKSFTQKVTCDSHVLTHTRNYPFSCDSCSKRFTTKSKLNFHKKKHGEPQYSCSLCEKQFATRQYLTAHYESHNIAQTEAAPCCLDTVSENSRTQVVEVAQVSCAQCDVTFKSQRALTRHTKTKHDPLAPWYHCNVPDCSRPVKSFATRHQLNKHNQRHHGDNQRRFTCTTCGKEFAEKLSLINHQRQNHTVGLTQQQLKPHACHICPKRFTLKSKLTIHIRTHTRDPQFRCEICAKSFFRKDSLNRHRLQHSALPSNSHHVQAVVSCPVAHCEKIFKSRSALGFHLQIHNGDFKYHCDTCGKRFVRKCHYDGHVRTHSDERPFKCTTCGRGFKDRKHWREHVKRVHTNEITMQSLLDSITSEDALTSQHNSYHVMQQHVPALQPQPTDCLTDVDVTGSYVLNQASFNHFPSSSVQ